MLVDPQILRAFAARVDATSSVIESADIGSKVSAAADDLPASTTQWAIGAVGEDFSLLADRLAQNVTAMGAAVRGAGDEFEVTDDALAGKFDGLF
jgi:hypothetical protein